MKKKKKLIEIQWIVRSRSEYKIWRTSERTIDICLLMQPSTDRTWTRFCFVDCGCAASMILDSLNKTDGRYEFRLKP